VFPPPFQTLLTFGFGTSYLAHHHTMNFLRTSTSKRPLGNSTHISNIVKNPYKIRKKHSLVQKKGNHEQRCDDVLLADDKQGNSQGPYQSEDNQGDIEKGNKDCDMEEVNQTDTQKPSVLGPFSVTPFGVYCTICICPLGSGQDITTKTICRHLSQHPELKVKTLQRCQTLLQSELKRLKNSKSQTLYLKFTTGSMVQKWACSCSTHLFNHQKTALFHARRAKGCNPLDIHQILCHTSICGRVVHPDCIPSSHNEELHFLSPHHHLNTTSRAITLNFSNTKKKLLKYELQSENIDSYVAFFHPLVVDVGDMSLDATLCQFIGYCNDPILEHESELGLLLNASRNWLEEYSRLHVNMIPANTRAGIMNLGGEDIGEISCNITFSMRLGNAKLLDELDPMLKFCWRSPDSIFNDLKEEVCFLYQTIEDGFDFSDFIKRAIIPRFLLRILLQTQPNAFSLMLGVLFCIARGFRKVGNDGVKLVSCARFASQASAQISLYRAGVCGYLACLKNNLESESKKLVVEARASAVLNLVCPQIRRCREQQRRKPPRFIKSISPNGDITVGSIFVPKSKWSTAIPHLVSLCKDLLNLILIGDQWADILDIDKEITVVIGENQCSFSLNGTNISSSNLKLVDSAMARDKLEQLQAFMEIAFHGMGCGALRGTEVERLDDSFQSIIWHNNACYYHACVIKQFSWRSMKSKPLIEHRLPDTVSRIFLLCAHLSRSTKSSSLLFQRSNRKYTMNWAFQKLYNLPQLPTLLDMRHIETSIQNLIFPDSSVWDGVLTATEESATSAGHNFSTHKRHYGSKLEGSRELLYREFHAGIGEVHRRATSARSLDAPGLLNALRILYGPRAEYMSSAQESLTWSSAVENHKHTICLIPCGGGKSVSWIVPAYARLLNGLQRQTIFVLFPYSFLMKHQLESTLSLIGDVGLSLSIVSLRLSCISERGLPDSLSNDSDLPHIVYATVDAMASLMRHHSCHLKRWAEKSLLSKIFIDEIHCIFTESFRSVYEDISTISSYSVPIVGLSGSLPEPFLPSLFSFFHLGDIQQATIIKGGDPIRTGFRLSVSSVKHHSHLAAKFAKNFIDRHKSKGNDYSVHILCALKSDVDIISSEIDIFENYTLGRVTGDSSCDHMERTAADWREGKIDILVSTTVALVGNESSRCRMVVICGYIYNVLNMVQAIGRLRESQRGPDSEVKVIVPISDIRMQTRTEELDRINLLRLGEKGLIANEETNIFMEKLLSVKPLYQWVCNKELCRVGSLLELLGHQYRKCGNCDVCGDSYVRRTSATAQAVVDLRLMTFSKAQDVLSLMEVQCVMCGKEDCDGTSCLPTLLGYRMVCSLCGGQHKRASCSVNYNISIGGRACFSCLSLKDVVGVHTPDQCKHTKKIKCAVFVSFRRTRQVSSFDDYLTKLYSSKDNWCLFISSLV
jgi:superfamily II DNA helicase RecQ